MPRSRSTRNRRRRSTSILRPKRNRKPLPRRPRRKADRMPDFDPVPAPGEALAQPVVVPTPRKSRAGVFFLGACSGCLVVFVAMFFLGMAIAMIGNNDTTTRGDVFGEKVAIIPIDGEILGSRDTIDALHRYAKNDSVKAIIMRINSPGAAIAPPQESYEAIRHVRPPSAKPIV